MSHLLSHGNHYSHMVTIINHMITMVTIINLIVTNSFENIARALQHFKKFNDNDLLTMPSFSMPLLLFISYTITIYDFLS